MKFLLGALLLGLLAAAPQCETRGPEDAGTPDAGPRRDAGPREPGDPDWDPSLPDGGFPGSGKNGDPGTDVVILVRMDRGLANDAALYKRLVDEVRGALTGAGLRVLETAVASLQDGTLLWAQFKNAAPPAALVDVLSYHAQHTPDQAGACSTSGLFILGSQISYATLSYPAELTGFPWVEQPFWQRPGALLVVLVDHDIRPATLGSVECSPLGLSPTDWFGAYDPAVWLSWYMPRPQTRFWAISTPEAGSNPDLLRDGCLAGGFPAVAVDTIAPSPAVSFYDPWAEGMSFHYPRLVERESFCNVFGAGGFSSAPELAAAWARVLRGQVGLP